MDDIFAKKAWCSPVAIASSSGLSIKHTDESSGTGSDTEAESGCVGDESSGEFLRKPFFHSSWIYLVLILLFCFL